MLLAFVCGLGLFLLLLPCLQGEPAAPPAGRKNSRKGGLQRRGRSRSRKKNAALAACGDCLDYLKETWNLISLVQSLLGTVPATDSSYQPLDQDPPDKEYKRAAGGPPRPHWEHVDSTAKAPLTKHLLPLASSPSSGPAASSVPACLPASLTASQSPGPLLPLGSLSPQPLALPLPPPCPPGACAVPPAPCSTPPLPGPAPTLSQSDSMDLPLDAVTRSSSPPKHMLASPIPHISSLSHTSSAIPALPWWQLAARALCLTTSSDSESQKGPLSHQPPRAVSLGVPTSRQMEAGNPSLHGSDDQNILGIKVTRKVEVKIWKEKEKDGTFLEQMSPGYNLSSLRNMLNSLGAEQDLTVPQPFWEIKDKVKQLLGPQQLSYSKVLGDHLEQKYNQLFWGLPSLHSESLAAAAWISQGASTLQPTCFLFNRISSVCSVQVQDKMSPLLSQPQSPPLILSMSQFQPQTLGQFQTQVHLPSSFQALLPSSPPHITDCAASGPTSQNKPQSLLPTEFQHTQMPWIGKQLGCGWALPSVVQRPQEVFNILPTHLSQDNCPDSILPENLPVSSELREQLEQHIQRWLMQPRWDQMQKSLELMQLREGTSQEVPGTCRAKDKPCPLQASLSIGDSSRDSQKVRFQLEKDTGKHLGHILGKHCHLADRQELSQDICGPKMGKQAALPYILEVCLKSRKFENDLTVPVKCLLEVPPEVAVELSGNSWNPEEEPSQPADPEEELAWAAGVQTGGGTEHRGFAEQPPATTWLSDQPPAELRGSAGMAQGPYEEVSNQAFMK
uniref:spermatogenesis-associated protein 31A6-like n=1 Tax=Ictidomys tridecemlineatus TaxID=43179 RepID=UPI001A9EBDE0|nr:spermatogenesis-associated protein 31A6-like [Ictidomys tridecemlineatus]